MRSRSGEHFHLLVQELVKAGVGITQDALKLERDYNIQVKGLCCLSDEANKRLASSPQSFTKWSLAGATLPPRVCRLWPPGPSGGLQP